MSRMRTSCASFSCARPAIRRACSIGVRGSSSPFLLATSVATVQAADLDFPSDGLWHQPCNRFSVGYPLPDLARRNLRRLDLERDDPVAVALEIGRWITRARPHGKPHPAQDLVRLLPAREVRALVRADYAVRVAEAPAAPRVGGASAGLVPDLARPRRQRGPLAGA